MYFPRLRDGALRLLVRLRHGGVDRGDVPGWVLVTVMTAGLVTGLWVFAGPKLQEIFESAIDGVSAN